MVLEGQKMRRRVINSGDQFFRLTVIREAETKRQPSGQVKRQFVCRCVCGNTITAQLDNLTGGKIKSCGCLAQENRTAHGHSSNPLIKLWYGMHKRCLSAPGYADRGIKVCEAWATVEPFLSWAATAGYAPGLELDRKNNNGDYSPDNCRFVSKSTNQRNKRNTLMVTHPDTGQTIPLISLWEAEGNPDLSWVTVRDRYLYRGWSVKEAITKPKRGQT
jgi:hypothetical protein